MEDRTTEAPPRTAPPSRPRSARFLDAALVLAVLAAIGLAVSGVAVNPAALPEGAVASVNGQPIARADFDALLGKVAAQLAHAPEPAERAEVLARMIDEELLIQRGLELGLVRREGRLRSLLVQEVMSQVLAGVRAQPVDDAELARFYALNAGYFARPAAFRVRRYDFADVAAAETLRAVLRPGAGTGELRASEAARNALLPDAPLPAAKLREYLGDALAERVTALAPGEGLVQPREDGGASVLVLLEAQTPLAPAFDRIHAEVEAEYRRRRDEEALAAYLASLREEARLVVGGEAR
jgi:hypothetical protein